jgi:hypothetical protein
MQGLMAHEWPTGHDFFLLCAGLSWAYGRADSGEAQWAFARSKGGTADATRRDA